MHRVMGAQFEHIEGATYSIERPGLRALDMAVDERILHCRCCDCDSAGAVSVLRIWPYAKTVTKFNTAELVREFMRKGGKVTKLPDCAPVSRV